jgi:serine/threonine-protein kinase
VERVIPVVAPSPDHLRTMTTTMPLPLPTRPRRPDATVSLPAPAAGASASRQLAPGGASQPTAVLPPSVSATLRPEGRGHRLVAVAVVAVALVLLAAVVWSVLNTSSGGSGTTSGTTSSSAPSSSTSPTTTPTTPPPTTPPPVQLAAADYVGRPVAAVQTALTSLGLTVQLKPVHVDHVAAGRVVGVDPAGAVAQGSTVTVSYVAAPTPTPTKDGGKDRHPPGKDRHGG